MTKWCYFYLTKRHYIYVIILCSNKMSFRSLHILWNWLDVNFPAWWIRRNGPTAWLPGLIPMDFFTDGFMKNYVYSTRANTRKQLIQRIRKATEVLRDNLQILNMSNAITRWLHLCSLQNRGRGENLKIFISFIGM